MAGENQTVKDARFSRAVCAEDESKRPKGNPLRFGKGFEVSDPYSSQHQSLTLFLSTVYGTGQYVPNIIVGIAHADSEDAAANDLACVSISTKSSFMCASRHLAVRAPV